MLRFRTGSVHAKGAKVGDPFLLVNLRTARKTFREFEARALRLIPQFKTAGLDLLISGWRVDGENVRIVNLWDLKDANAVIKAELELVDDPDYLMLDRMLIGEDKQIVISVTDIGLVDEVAAARKAREANPRSMPDDRYVYAFVTNDIETSDLAEFRARYEARVSKFRKDSRWEGGDGFLGLTGSDDSVFQFWRVPERLQPGIADYLTRTPWDDVPDEPAKLEILQPSAFDQLMPLPPV